MNRISNVIVLAAVAAVGFSATARTMTRPRVEIRPDVPIEVRPTPRTSPADTIVRENRPTSLDQFRGQPAVQPPVNFIDEKGNTCNAEVYSSKLVSGTSVSYADGLALVKGGYVMMGVCGVEQGALLGYDADARETLLLSMLQVSKSANGRAFHQLSTTERVQLKTVLAEALAKAKNRNGGSKYSAATEMATAEKIMASKEEGGCSLIPKF
jgi:hypothetical protein